MPASSRSGYHASAVKATTGSSCWPTAPDKAPAIKQELLRRKNAGAPIGDVASVEDLLPTEQQEKLALLAHIRRIIDKVKSKLDARERALALEHRPPAGLRPLTVADLPAKLLEAFREKDGTIGRVGYISPPPGHNVGSGRDLIRFADAAQEISPPNGETRE